MSFIYNAEEIFELAIHIEENGAVFYAQARDWFQDAHIKSVFKRLEGMEKEHQKQFRELKENLSELPEATMFDDPEGQLSQYLKALADSHVFGRGQAVANLLPADATSQAVLELALRFEKESILFFTEMQNIVPNELGKAKIAQLIHEERGHINFIHHLIETLDGSGTKPNSLAG